VSEEGPLLRAGRVGRPHGLDGSFHVTRPWPELLQLGATVELRGEGVKIVRRAGTDQRPIVRLEGFESREAVEAARGAELLAPRGAAPALEEDEWYAADLERCRVWDGPREVGKVRRMLALPSCEVLEVEREAAGAPLLVPLVRDAVRSVDVATGRIDVDLRFLGED
jgi:16S rRNA processing protein RimM